MPLKTGTRLGPYEIVSELGAGAMGEVYRARDSRLRREAAIKVLPAAYSSDPESLRRFEHEARAASALNHPNIVTVYDIGSVDSVSYIAMELVEGRSLRDLMSDGQLPLRKVLEIGSQIADGLAAAHAKGLVHRDLKPQNLMVTKDGHLKILDFGLAKLTSPASLGSGSDDMAQTAERSLTTPGTILGTVGYMSPEQAKGEPADFRSDQFSLGVILYEMASGKRAFDRGSAIETLSAILRDEPSPLAAADPRLPGPFCWIVERCLAKEAGKRYESTRDLAWDLKGLWDHLSQASAAGPFTLAAAPPRRSAARRVLFAAVAVAAAALAVFAAMRWQKPGPPPLYQPLTFHRGTVSSARFAPDGKTVIYAAAWEGGPFRLFRKAAESGDSRPLELPDANLLSVSRSGELAATVSYRIVPPGRIIGTLVQAPLEGGAPRELASGVFFADWAPNGRDLAVVRSDSGKTVLEFPIGVKLYETGGSVSYPRVSPKGDLVAFLDHPIPDDNRGTVAVIDRSGRKRTLTPEWAAEEGLAWHPSGNEIWFGATPRGFPRAVHAVTLAGKTRVVVRAPGKLTLHDIAPGGRVLVTRETWRIGIFARPPGEPAERDISWLDESLLTDLSADGTKLLFTQVGGTVDSAYAGFLRRVNEKSPMRVGDGFARALSPDGSLVLSIMPTDPPELYALPTGSGQPRRIVPKGLNAFQSASWFPDGKRILVAGTEPGHGMRLYVCDLESGAIRAITPEGIFLPGYQGIPISPDGLSVAALMPDGRLGIFAAEGGPGRPIPEAPVASAPIGWTANGQFLLTARLDEVPAQVFRVDVRTGRSELWKKLVPSDPAGVLGFPSIHVTPDGSAYAYSFLRILSELYGVDGLK